MKSKILFFCLLAMLLACVPFHFVSAQGIQFMDYKKCTMNDVLEKAQAENKYIFVDIWTPWCGVCKMMDRYIFPRKDVGELFNNKFVNISFDAENSGWTDVAKNFNATAYPTMLMLNPQGEIVWNIDNLGIPMEEDLTKNESAVAGRLMAQAKMAEELLTMPDDRFIGKENWTYLYRQTPGFDSKVFDRTIQLQDTLMALYPVEFSRMVKNSLGSAAVNMTVSVNHRPVPNEHKMNQYREVVEKLHLSDKNSLLVDMEITVSLRVKDWQQSLQIVTASEKYMTPGTYATIMDEMAENCSDKKLLQQAVNVTENAFQETLSSKDKEMLAPLYNKLVDASEIANAEARKKH